MLGNFLIGLAYSKIGPQGFCLQLSLFATNDRSRLANWLFKVCQILNCQGRRGLIHKFAHAAICMQIYQIIWRMPELCLHKHFHSLQAQLLVMCAHVYVICISRASALELTGLCFSP